MSQVARLLGCDWGTSSFRLMVLDAQGGILQSVHSKQGVSQLPREKHAAFLESQLAQLAQEYRDLPLLMCGMVGSTLGLQAVPYVDTPASLFDLAQALAPLEVDSSVACIVPGIRTRDGAGNIDVMRGEETQVAGWLATCSAGESAKALLCLPGTHTKWVQIREASVAALSTSLTGELYALLSQYSVLVRGEQHFDLQAFDAGVQTAKKSDALLSTLFSARARVLDSALAENNAAAYVSGLLIGSDIGEQKRLLQQEATLHIIGDPGLTTLYERAATKFEIASVTYDGNAMVAEGLCALYREGAGSHVDC